MKNHAIVSACAVLLALVAAAPASAAIVEIGASKDNTLYQSAQGDVSNGVGEHLFTGLTLFNEIRRTVIAFDVASVVPRGSIIVSATLKLRMSKTIAAPQLTSLHRTSADWGEGASDAQNEEGIGDPAEPGDATWLHTFFATDFWSTTGGDFNPVPSADTLVAGIGFYEWSSNGMVADVQAWVDDSSENFGWVIIGNEITIPSAKRFDSRENANESYRPLLTIEYSESVPASSGLGLVLLTIALLAAGTFLAPRYRAAPTD